MQYDQLPNSNNQPRVRNEKFLYFGLGWVILSGFIFQFIGHLDYDEFLGVYYNMNSVIWSVVPLAITSAIRDAQVRMIFTVLSLIYLAMNVFQLMSLV
jgi:hypothetical protein